MDYGNDYSRYDVPNFWDHYVKLPLANNSEFETPVSSWLLSTVISKLVTRQPPHPSTFNSPRPVTMSWVNALPVTSVICKEICSVSRNPAFQNQSPDFSSRCADNCTPTWIQQRASRSICYQDLFNYFSEPCKNGVPVWATQLRYCVANGAGSKHVSICVCKEMT